MIKLFTVMTLPESPLMASVSPLAFVQSTSAPPAKTLFTSPVGVRINRPTPEVLVVKYVLPALDTAPLLQFVEPVTDEVPSASFDFSVTWAAGETQKPAGSSTLAKNGTANDDRSQPGAGWVLIEFFILIFGSIMI